MEKPNILREKSYAFALKIVSFCRSLMDSHEYILSKQLMKSGTSIGANIEEGLQPQSKADFISKLSISLKEAHESDYWLRLICDSKLAEEGLISPLRVDAHELISLLTAIIKTSKANMAMIASKK